MVSGKDLFIKNLIAGLNMNDKSIYICTYRTVNNVVYLCVLPWMHVYLDSDLK
jgi:hypothetical protein